MDYAPISKAKVSHVYDCLACPPALAARRDVRSESLHLARAVRLSGWLWGTALGWPILITTASIALGLVVGVLMMRINPYGAELLQLCLLLVLPWFLDGAIWRWTLLVMCIVPLPRMIAGLVIGRTWT